MNEEAKGSPRTGEANPFSAALALGGNGPLDPRAAAFLEKQSRLTDLQIEDVERENRLRHWQLRFGNLSLVMKVAFEVALAFIFLVIAFGLGTAIWMAAHDDSLVIEAFSVPPDMAARGLTGQAVAAQLQDRLAALQDATLSSRPSDSYLNNWGDDIKVQIPDTGISIGQFYRILAGWLGHQTHITGEVYRSGDGIAITVRATAAGSAVVNGTEANVDVLIERAAEAIYARTQPYRYGTYIEYRGRALEAQSIHEKLSIEGATPRERAWGYIGRGYLANLGGDRHRAAEYDRQAIGLMPDFARAWSNLQGDEDTLGHDEEAFRAVDRSVQLMGSGRAVDLTPHSRSFWLRDDRAEREWYTGDYQASFSDAAAAGEMPSSFGDTESARNLAAMSLGLLHQYADARRMLARFPVDPGLKALQDYQRGLSAMRIDFAAGNWDRIIAQQDALERNARDAIAVAPFGPAASEAVAKPRQSFVEHFFDDYFMRVVRPEVACATARLGEIASAHRMIDATPLDCYLCVRVRARIAAASGNLEGADYWFGRAVDFAPSLPSALSEWGEVLLHKGDYEGAIAKFEQAHARGPHFADPLEMWGEALMQKNRSDLALAKFEEADKYAPHWGRLHLKWGEALMYAGNRTEAQKHFAVASHLDLSPADAAALRHVRATHA